MMTGQGREKIKEGLWMGYYTHLLSILYFKRWVVVYNFDDVFFLFLLGEKTLFQMLSLLRSLPSFTAFLLLPPIHSPACR